MNWVLIGFIYLLSVPGLMFLASRVHKKSVYRFILGLSIVLSFIPISIGIFVLRATFADDEWTIWSYIAGGSGLFCILFGLMALIPMIWLASQERKPN